MKIAVAKNALDMKFYDRQKELEALEITRNISFTMSSQMTVVTGRRRIGKTKLILKSCENTPTAYLFVARSNEATLCNQFTQSLRQALGIFVPEGIVAFRELFAYCMEVGRTHCYNLVLDEFQEFYNINQSVFSEVQDIWDRMKDDTHVNLIVSGSVFTLIHRIFQDYKEPLYGRASSILRLKPFPPSVLKQILRDYNDAYSNDDLLALYMITGGVPKYLEILMERGCVNRDEIIDEVCGENSIFIDEGNVLIMQEMGKQYGTYYSVLAAIANGMSDTTRMSQVTGIGTLGGILQRLEEDYDIIAKQRPIFAKPGSKTVRYEIKDHFMRFWFRYIVKYQSLIQSGQFNRLKEIVRLDYTTYSGRELESYFKDKMCEEQHIAQIGSWWAGPKGNSNDRAQNEIDIVALYYDSNKAFVAEVKRDKRNFHKTAFEEKVNVLRTRHLANYDIETGCLGLLDM